jgi:hypothetical protein
MNAPARLLLRLALICPGLCAAAAASAAPEVEAGDPAHHLRQAKLFFKKGWMADAADELALARKSTAGQAMYEVWWMSSQVAYERANGVKAREFAAQARTRAVTAEEQQQSQGWIDQFDANMGFVEVDGPQEGLKTRLQLERSGLLFDPGQKRYLDRLALDWRERSDLPLKAALPTGEYLINGQAVSVKAGQTVGLRLPFSAIGNKGMAALQVTRFEVAGGVTLPMGGLSSLRPAPTTQLAVTVPVKQVLVGAMVDLAPQWASLGNDRLRAPGGWSGAARVGTELFTSLPLSIRPSAVLRVGQLPAVPMACVAAGEDWSCAVGEAGPGELPVLARGTAWMPGGELVVEYREAGRTTALGAGIKVEVNAILGELPGSGEAQTSGEPLCCNLSDAAVRGASARVLANLSLAF